jgi:hypothetical protein
LLQQVRLKSVVTFTLSQLERFDDQLDRAEEAYEGAWNQHNAAVAEVSAEGEAFDHACELMTRMEAWLARPNRRTPFPWPDEEYVVPSNQFDLDYYVGRPDVFLWHNAYPPGVREWRERFDSYVYDGQCNHHEDDTCGACYPLCELCRCDPCMCESVDCE